MGNQINQKTIQMMTEIISYFVYFALIYCQDI